MPVHFDNNTRADWVLEIVYDWAADPKGRRIQVYAERRSLERQFGLTWHQPEALKAAFDTEKVKPEALGLIHSALVRKARQVRIS